MTSKQKPTLVVLAAGMGSRYGGLKQMDPMGPNGETVLDYAVYDALRAGFGTVIFIIRRSFEADFKEKIGAKFEDKITVKYAFQDLEDLPEGFSVPEGRVKPWGTAHAILAIKDIIDTPFATINADDFYGYDSYAQIVKHFEKNPPHTDAIDHYCMVGYNLENTLSDHGNVNRGLCISKDGLLVNVEEHTEIQIKEDGVCRGENLAGERVEVSVNALASMNFWGFSPSILSHFEEYFIEFLKERGTEMKSECYIPTIVDDLITEGKADCTVLETSSSWFGVTYPKDKEMVVKSLYRLIAEGAYPENLWA